MIQKSVEWHLNTPYDLHALAPRHKDCLNQKNKMKQQQCLSCPGVAFRKDHNVIPLSTLQSFPAWWRSSQKATGLRQTVAVGGTVPHCKVHRTSVKCSGEGQKPEESFNTMNWTTFQPERRRESHLGQAEQLNMNAGSTGNWAVSESDPHLPVLHTTAPSS